ncbi:MAG TPA: transposase [Steroidobacteraceae bacterium]|jgi:transposase|nr:transposase [Steroidobacteraceae bacterium]
MASHEAIPRDSTSASQRIEIITGHERRRQYSDADKVRLIAEAAQPGRSVHEVARRHGICSSLLYRWRRMGLGSHETNAAPQLIPVHVSAGERETPSPLNPAPGPALRVARVVEIALPNGCTVRVDQHVDGRALRRILAALRG